MAGKGSAPGERRGGRKKGTPNRRNHQLARKAAAAGITPLEFMLKIMRKESLPPDASIAQIIAHESLRFEAAKAAAPYMHAKLASVEHSGKGGGPVVLQLMTSDAAL